MSHEDPPDEDPDKPENALLRAVTWCAIGGGLGVFWRSVIAALPVETHLSPDDLRFWFIVGAGAGVVLGEGAAAIKRHGRGPDNDVSP